VKAKSLSEQLLELTRANPICPICQRPIEPVYASDGVCELCFSDRAERYKCPSASRVRRAIPIKE
jgi:predicted amidophosphoribosyltransferase